MKKFTSTVVKGLGVGKKIGYPTVNLAIPRPFTLKQGVYGCTLFIKESLLQGILYFGPRFYVTDRDKQLITLEVHILTPQKALHPHTFPQGIPESVGIHSLIKTISPQEKISVAIRRFLRPPVKVTSLKILKKQIGEDINKLTSVAC